MAIQSEIIDNDENNNTEDLQSYVNIALFSELNTEINDAVSDLNSIEFHNKIKIQQLTNSYQNNNLIQNKLKDQDEIYEYFKDEYMNETTLA
jgi:hypothetical protein